MKTLVLVRHGVTDWNENGRLMGRSDVELNDNGRAQAQSVAVALGARSIEAIYSSPQLRARQTAAPLASASSRDVTVDADFDEVWLSDAWKGKTVAELRENADLEPIIERIKADPTYRCDAIEPIADVHSRTVAGVERLREQHDHGTVVIFSHGDPLRVIIAHYLGLDLTKFRRLACDNGSITEIAFNPRGPRVTVLNDAP